MTKITVMKTEADFAEIHQNYGGSSYSAALFDRGYADMPSAWSVWALFSGKLEDVGPDEETNARVRIGKAIEPIIAGEVAHKMGWDLIEGYDYHDVDLLTIPLEYNEGRIFVHHPDKELKIGCTVDRYIREHEDGPGIVECKNRDFLQWVENYTDDDASIRDQIQLAHQFACHPEIQWGAVAALVGGNDLKIYRYKRADLQEMIDDVESRWRWLWGKIESQEEPTLTGGELPNWLRVHDEGLGVHEEALPIGGDTVADGMTFDQLAEEYLDAVGRRTTYGKIEKERKAQIVQHLQEFKFARSNRYKVRASYAKVQGKSVTVAEVEAAGGELVIRNAHIRVTLKFDDDPMTEQGSPSASPRPSQSALKKAMDAQAPLKDCDHA